MENNFNFIVLAKYSNIERPMFFLTAIKKLKSGDKVFFYDHSIKKIATILSNPINIDIIDQTKIKNIKKFFKIINYANKFDMQKYKEKESICRYIIKEANQEALKLDKNIIFFACEQNNLKDYTLLFVQTNNKENLEILFKNIKNIFKSKHININFTKKFSKDRTKIIGGLGDCGKKLCCNLFFETIKNKKTNDDFKKDKNIYNDQKSFGVCGCLKCCLAFENK